ncbi:MAG TPA: hypothetical protein VGL93_35010 [Streptosporangiaceae bacterium]
MTDPYRTGELRTHVLDAWTAAPARFREDANAEEDYALGGYRDRVIVELAQNAADAALRAGVPGHLRLEFDGRTLTAANTGAPLDTEGVRALSTLRASAKRDDTQVGRFGVGFAAVVAVSDDPVITSANGAVTWSRARTRAALTEIPALAAELAARDSHVPVLRLPFPADTPPPPGFTTAVHLPLRDQDAQSLVSALLAATGPALLLALPSLTTVEITTPEGTRLLTSDAHPAPDAHTAAPTSSHPEPGVTVIEADGERTRWRVVEDGGALDDALLADRPAEERARRTWSVRWAFPVDTDGAPVPLPPDVPPVVHAPTPSDEPQSLPALLLASFPLAPDRRHTAPGPLTDFLVDRAATTYARALTTLPRVPSLLTLVPVGLATGELDAALRRTLTHHLPDTPFLPHATPATPPPAADLSATADAPPALRPRDAVAISGGPGLIDVIAPVLPGLLPAGWPPTHPALRALGVRRLATADLIDALADLDRPPSWWRGLYTVLDAAEPDALGALPVPLADGRLVRGPRGLLVPTEEFRAAIPEATPLAPLGLRVVHPDAAHPLLLRLGATEATPRTVLDSPQVRAAVAASYESDDPDATAEAVLTLVAAAGLRPGDAPWLGELALRDADDEIVPAEELLLPGAPLAEVLADDAPFGEVAAPLADRFGAATLEAVGVLWTFTLLRAEDVSLDALDLGLDAEDDWADDLQDRLDDPVPPVVPEFTAVRDLELVAPDRWPRALELLSEPPLRAALRDPARVLRADGRTTDLPSYTGWWLARHPVLDGHRPGDLRLAAAEDADSLLDGLYPPAPSGLDPDLARALGVRTTLAELLAAPGGADELLARLADPALPVARDQLRDLWTELATSAAPAPPGPPARVRAVRGDAIVVADAADTVVLDAPDLLPLLTDCALVLAPWPYATRLADLLDLPLAGEEVDGAVDGDGVERPVPEPVRLPDAPATYVAHDRLTVDGVEVPWRYVNGVAHASGDDGLARAVAWSAGVWQARYQLAELLRTPAAAAAIRTESDLDP